MSTRPIAVRSSSPHRRDIAQDAFKAACAVPAPDHGADVEFSHDAGRPPRVPQAGKPRTFTVTGR